MGSRYVCLDIERGSGSSDQTKKLTTEDALSKLQHKKIQRRLTGFRKSMSVRMQPI